MHSHWSLVLFTLLVQSVVGSVWCMQLALFFNGGEMDSFYIKYHSVVVLGLVLVGLAAAMAHLGTPCASYNAARNIKRSWLSREIMAVNLFAGVLAIMAALAFINPGSLNQWMVLAESMTGGMALYAMTHVYLLRTVPAWNHAGTPFTFIGSTLLLGGALFTVLLNLFALTMNVGPSATHLAISQDIAFIVVLIGLILKVLAGGMYPYEKTVHTGPLKRLQPVMQTIGIALWAVSKLPTCRSGNFLTLFSLATVILVAGEIVHRVQFYQNYHRVGLQ